MIPRTAKTAWAALAAVGLVMTAGTFASCQADVGEPVAVVVSALRAHPGAIFTTVEDGSRVNHNIYEDKEDVYLDGGPGPNAPAGAAGLTPGEYYFQVTDPSGKDLLSTDHISCRKVMVNAEGVIEAYLPGTNYAWKGGPPSERGWYEVACSGHNTGIDIDHSEVGAITVQLMPYDDTPNRGGVYKVWMTPVGDYDGPVFDPEGGKTQAVNGEGWIPANAHGFIPRHAKTDNYKVHKKGKPCEPQALVLTKFHDANVNGVMDTGEQGVTGWGMTVLDPLGVQNTYFTPAIVLASPGTYTITEEQPAGTMITASYLDGVQLNAYPNADRTLQVTFGEVCAEAHAVEYGNAGIGEAMACKVYDRNADGVVDPGEPMVPGWRMTLEGIDVTGAVVAESATTDATGCAEFAGLLPGEYTMTEEMPAAGDWIATGPTEQTFVIESTLSGAAMLGTAVNVEFTNVCTGVADFNTKGYWHNKNGLTELGQADIDYANTLPPYVAPSAYFGAGDEPFDGLFENGTPVAAVNGTWGELIANAGTAKAEVSHFLVDPNRYGMPQEQLAQQLLAFLFNTRHRLDDPAASIQLPSGEFASAAAVVNEASYVWTYGEAWEQNDMATMLDTMNNSDAIPFVKWNPCEVVYPQ
jgi:hypothetical protein